MPVIGTLTVNLEANTATFSGDLGKASKSAEDFGRKAVEAGGKTTYSMLEAKGSMMLLSEELGVHIPRHLQTLIAELPGVGAAFGAMLPLVGVIAAIAIIEKLVAKNEEAREKLAQGWDTFGTESALVFDNLDDKMLKVGKTADQLAGRHLEALRKELTLIDHASLRELAQEFGKLEKAGQSLMVEMKSSWYEVLSGSQGAANALTHMNGEVDLLLAKGDRKGAFDKLVGTLGSANEELKKMVALEGTMYAPSQKHVDAQRLEVDIIKEKIRAMEKEADINAGEKTNAKTGEAQAEAGRQEATYNAQQTGLERRRKAEENYAKERLKLHGDAVKDGERIAEEQAKATEAVGQWELRVQTSLADETLKNSEATVKLKSASEIEGARHSLAMRQSTAQAAADVEVKAAQTATRTEVAALDQRIESLNKHDAEYLVKLKQLEDKKAQIIKQGGNEVTKIQNKAEEEKFQDVERAELKIANAIAKTTARSIIEGGNMAKAFADLGKSMSSAALDSVIQMETVEGRKKLIKAKGAASSAYTSVFENMAIPYPINQILAPIAAGAAFAGVMAFEQGGMIPGTGPVPIVGHGGESVVTKALTDRVEASEGRGGGRRPVSIVFNVVTKDADSFKASQSQLHSQAFHAATTASKKNR
jgi:hypothetical protein